MNRIARKLRIFFHKQKYELLLAALVQHLFVGMLVPDILFYFKIIWPINMLLLGIASTGVFIKTDTSKRVIRDVLFVVLLGLTLASPVALNTGFMTILSIVYVVFFVYLFWEVIQFLIQPSYIDTDIILASACGYLLLIEISVFLFQAFYYRDTASFTGIDTSNGAVTYIDFVYFTSITFTSIGFGDITPNLYYTKLATALTGVLGQFYSVVLVGILISKFSSHTNKPGPEPLE